MRICVVNYPATTNFTPLDNLLLILSSIFPNIHCIYGETEFNHHKFNDRITHHIVNKSYFFASHSRILNYIFLQLEISKKIILLRNQIEVLIFFIGGDTLLIPFIIARLLNKQIVLLSSGSSIITHQMNQDKLTIALKVLRTLCLILADKIIVYSPNVILVHKFYRYRRKIIVSHRHFIDFSTFTVTTPYRKRPQLIGYIGRLSGEKGVQNFALALPDILNQHKDLHGLIAGDGELKGLIESILIKNNLADRVDLPGWIAHENLPKYLNQLRLLVLPSSDSEGLPNIMLEAMACGTPVLATSASSIPDLIINGKTGIIIENNSPECITQNVQRVLECPEMEEIAEAGRRYVEEEHRFEKVLERWKDIISKF